MDLLEIATRFDSEESCLEYLATVRWPDGPVCPKCGSENVHDLPDRREYQCNGCRRQFSVTSGTVMHRSHLPTRKWLIALHLVCSAKKGISACQLERHLDVSYRTAWYLLQRIRTAMSDGDEIASQFDGIVEADDVALQSLSDISGVRECHTSPVLHATA